MKKAELDEIGEILEFLKAAERLKTIKRTNYLSNGAPESDADHSWMLGLMAIVLSGKMANKINLEKVLMLAIVHDLAEAETGDMPLHEQLSDGGAKETKAAAELAAMGKMTSLLPKKLGEQIMNLWQEYEENQTAEAKFAKAIDKLEGTFQALCYGDISYWAQYGNGNDYYDIVLNDQKKPHWEHEETLVEIGEILKRITKEQMKRAGKSVDIL